MEDPFPLVQGRGFEALRASGIDVQVGVEHEAALRLNQPYLSAVRTGRPFVTLKAATSLDGRMAAAPGRRTQLTSLPSIRHAHGVRAQVDAVAVGSGTVLVDDPLLTVREVYRERPLTRVVFDRRLRVPPTARLFSTLSAGPVIVLTSTTAMRDSGPRIDALRGAGVTVLGTSATTCGSGLQLLGSLGDSERGARRRGRLACRRLGRGRGGRRTAVRGAGIARCRGPTLPRRTRVRLHGADRAPRGSPGSRCTD
jgi:diaminohydroxyphosphoribosylaminopyrimidine deaminase/5-amino-6-(5-phosphoribosylamino)uracil reductase